MTIGIIGYGAFGRLLATLLPEDAGLRAFDCTPALIVPPARAASLEECCQSDIVIFAVPVQDLQDVLSLASPHLKPGTWVLDVASVKTLPARWMTDILPAHVDITATHPLFGPQSAARGLAGQKLVVCPIRGNREATLMSWAGRLGLDVVVTTPEAHDRDMAHVQALTHLIGRALVRTGRPDIQVRTHSYQHLRELAALIEHDSDALFAAIQQYNPHARNVVARFRSEMDGVLSALPDEMSGAPLAGDQD